MVAGFLTRNTNRLIGYIIYQPTTGMINSKVGWRDDLLVVISVFPKPVGEPQSCAWFLKMTINGWLGSTAILRNTHFYLNWFMYNFVVDWWWGWLFVFCLTVGEPDSDLWSSMLSCLFNYDWYSATSRQTRSQLLIKSYDMNEHVPYLAIRHPIDPIMYNHS